MSDSKLHLMSFAPVPDTKTTVHVVGLPDSLRGCMVQLYKNDMRVNLPAPLHLAEQVEEYIWDWELTGRR